MLHQLGVVVKRSEIAKLLTYATCNRFMQRGAMFSQVNIGRGVIDLLVLTKVSVSSLQHGGYGLTCEITGVEIKSCRNDFTSDKKWLGYLVCGILDRFEFVTMEGAITPKDLTADAIKQQFTVPQTKAQWRESLRHGGRRRYIEDTSLPDIWGLDGVALEKVNKCVGLKVYSQESLEEIKRKLRITKHPWLPTPKPLKKAFMLNGCLPDNLIYGGWREDRADLLKRLLFKGSNETQNRLRMEVGSE